MEIKLTQYSHGAGCGCKISPSILETMLHTDQAKTTFPSLLVGNESKDDAAVYDLGDGTCIVSTTDFFMPIVDDPFLFGGIASVNAISDVYAMGGEPLIAIAILGWPINKVPAEVARQVLEGGREACRQAGIPLAGGHSIDCPEPVFGLAVTGKVMKAHLKQNNKAKAGSLLYLTKPLGIGIVTTAQKKGIVEEVHLKAAVDSMLALNSIGAKLGRLPYVNALTDVTGFGLLGHLAEVCEGSNVSAEIVFDEVPAFNFLAPYVRQGSMPGGTLRNWQSYGHKVSTITDAQRAILADPQTSGGLLVAVDEGSSGEFEAMASQNGLRLRPFGKLVPQGEVLVVVN
ncbi:MAG: selenide, water dikinase SelD [Cyclobacteriaceae bacterium]|nr:selenide, water dikinase SelD [Cyclobacteriaceae bacterium]MCB0499493.1 selenide, water dikinase SelD [Cyclobacteriaceae bacterium]MCB9238074.1 selenide, water dikinase SelD [Flammeovirgaceae bacterium]MCO5272534.1 selenide, water dikinase SelD [Cyclobacteriaceae bacterium]MCW5901602.1 selenide, water dikinase SelD [Cyclobacteriaceae bacterium]